VTTVARAYGSLWAMTGLAAVTARLSGVALVHVGTPRDTLEPSITTALNLAVHNTQVALWPLALAALRWGERPRTRWLGDALVGGQLLVHGSVVGGALGEQPDLWRYLPHLPCEWWGIAVPVAGWSQARKSATPPRLALLVAVSCLALVVAAALETWAVPL
jgi:hypothetical protein